MFKIGKTQDGLGFLAIDSGARLLLHGLWPLCHQTMIRPILGVRCGLPVIQEEWLRTPHKIRLPKCSVSQLSLAEHFAEVNDALLRGGALC